jgi:hypothetical protein
MTVSGLTIIRHERQPDQSRAGQTRKRRSRFRSLGRFADLWRAASCWRRAKFSATKAVRGSRGTSALAPRSVSSTHSGAKLDLLWVRGGRRWGFEFKRTSSPRLTSSLKAAMETPRIQKAFLVHAGDKSFPLDGHVTAVAAARLLDDVG